MLLAYCGAGYQDRQTNPGAFTIEGAGEQTLFCASAIGQCNFGDLRKVGWMRGARMDVGVSAVGHIVSARLVIDPPREPAASDGAPGVWRDIDLTIAMASERWLFLLECCSAAYSMKFYHWLEEVTEEGYEEFIRKFRHDVI